MSSSVDGAPTWADFPERPQVEVTLQSPAAELRVLLQRYRSDLDDAVRAAGESRAHDMRALAEQAALVVELETMIERHAPALHAAELGPVHDALRILKDRMLAVVAGAGLEVVRLAGLPAEVVMNIADVECWRPDDACTRPVVVEELAAAVRLDGVALRLGRVVMGAPGGAEPPDPAETGQAARRLDE